jgi:glycosyltransferase involved in cell wall biosynthesis
MVKSLLLVTDFYKPHTSGIITYIDLFINTLKLKNIQITILTTKHNIKDKEIEYIQGVKIIRCRPLLKISRGFYSVELVFKFIKISKNFDLINLHLPLTEILPLVFFLKKNKSFLTYHCLPEFPYYAVLIKFYFYFFGIIAMFKSKKIIVLSNDYFNNIFCHNFFFNKTFEIPPYVKINSSNKYFSKENEPIKIGYLGRLSSEKGIENLINVCNKMQLKKIQHELIIAGNDKDERFIKHISYLKKISSQNRNIKFIGFINDQDKSFFYNKINLFILPSTNSFEAFGIVQLEAMSYGVPVYASDIDGVRTIVKKTGGGLLFKNKNNNELFDKIRNFWKYKFQSKVIKSNVEKEYNENKFKKEVFNLLKFF